MSGKHYLIATQNGYLLDNVTGYPHEFHSKAAAVKALAEEVQDAAQACRRSHGTCSVVGSARSGSVQIKVGGRQGYHLWQRYVINEREGARKPPRAIEHHSTIKGKSPRQLDAEIATALGRPPTPGYRIGRAPDDGVTACSGCGVPAHASETDDLGRCAKCVPAKKIPADLEAAVKAAQLYIGKGLTMRITDEQKLYRRMNQKIALVAKRRGLDESEAYRQIMGEAKRRGGVSAIPGKDI